MDKDININIAIEEYYFNVYLLDFQIIGCYNSEQSLVTY